MDNKSFFSFLKLLEQNNLVQKEVRKNFFDNLWWPKSIEDQYLRLLIGGLSSRISYSMIDTYRKVIFDLAEIGYTKISTMNDDDIITLIRPLGLYKTRVDYIKSMVHFISENASLFDIWSDDLFIEKIATNVRNASYKIGQCCVLYYRMYPNLIMPIDSGMKDVLLPCLGFEYQKKACGNEVLRKKLTAITKEIKKDYLRYTKLDYLNELNFYWWVHLSLIYYKRLYCNKKDISNCIFRNKGEITCFKCMTT